MKTWINKVASGIFDGISENGSWRWVEAGVVQGLPTRAADKPLRGKPEKDSVHGGA